MKHTTAAILTLLLSACGGGGGGGTEQYQAPVVVTSEATSEPDTTWHGQWQEGLGEYAEKTPEGWVIDMPTPKQQPHYYTKATGSLIGKTKVTLTYRVELASGAAIVPVKNPAAPSQLTLYVQRQGDNWMKEDYRWWASSVAVQGIKAGTYTIYASFSEDTWTNVLGHSNKAAFEEALKHADRVGFTLGGGDGLGHGVYATGPARFVIVDFKVE